MKRQFAFLFLILFTACANRQVYVNKSNSCKLVLRSDSTYSLKYPTFLGSRHRTGNYKIADGSILMDHVTNNTYDSLSWSSTYLREHPDTVEFSFKNLYESGIPVSFTINQHPQVFKTDTSGSIKLLYRDLEQSKIVKNNLFYRLDISYNDKKYVSTDTFARPTGICLTLNQFIGKPTVVMYSKFGFNNDTVVAYGFDPKAMGSDRKLTRK